MKKTMTMEKTPVSRLLDGFERAEENNEDEEEDEETQ